MRLGEWPTILEAYAFVSRAGPCECRARGEHRAARYQPAGGCRRAYRDPGTERVRQVDADQDDDVRVLSVGAGGDAGADLRARAVGPDGVEEAPGSGIAGAAGEA